jgi:LuxR family transcriptional regulator, maltose regulon positive regulatory protein
VKRALIDAVDCEDWPLVVALTETNWTQLLAMHSGRLHRALRATPREHFAGNPLALMTRELFEIDLAAPAPLPRLLTEIERIAVGRSPHCRRALEMNLAALIASRRRGQYDAAIAYYNQLESIGRAVEPHRAAETDGLTSFILAQSGILFELAGDSEHASRLLREAYRWAPASELDVSAKHTAGRLAMSLARLGLLRQARHWLDTADDGVTWTGQTARNSQAVMGLADATIAIASLEHEQARSALDALGSTMLHDEYWPFFVEAQTEFVLTWGDDAAIAAQLSAVRSRTNTAGLRSDGNGIADPLLAAAEANLLIALGRGTEARAVLDAPIRQSPILDEPRARLALLTGENERAVVIARTAVDRPSLSPQLRLKLTLTLAVALYRLHRARRGRAAPGRSSIEPADRCGAVRMAAARRPAGDRGARPASTGVTRRRAHHARRTGRGAGRHPGDPEPAGAAHPGRARPRPVGAADRRNAAGIDQYHPQPATHHLPEAWRQLARRGARDRRRSRPARVEYPLTKSLVCGSPSPAR